MVDLDLLNDDKIGFLDEFITQEVHYDEFSIIKNNRGSWKLIENTKVSNNIHNEDDKSFILKYAKKLLEVNFQSILISGLGLGIIPYVCQKNTQTVDVIEINPQVINLTKQLNHLQSNVNIINHDINRYIPNKNYDIILFDHWLTFAPNQELQVLINNFENYLEPNGIFYVPIVEQFQN